MAKHDSSVLTIRVPSDLGRRLAREARRQRRTRSAVARDLLAASLEHEAVTDRAAEAKRQSMLVRDHESEREALRFITDTADLRGWE
jgi:predicted transcriptional regulator